LFSTNFIKTQLTSPDYLLTISDPHIHHSTPQQYTYFETSRPAASTIRLTQCFANSGLCGVVIRHKKTSFILNNTFSSLLVVYVGLEKRQTAYVTSDGLSEKLYMSLIVTRYI